MEVQEGAVIRIMRRRDQTKINPKNKTDYSNHKDMKLRNTHMCKAYYGIGYCITNSDTICYNTAKSYILNYVEVATNKLMVKSNAYRYKKDHK